MKFHKTTGKTADLRTASPKVIVGLNSDVWYSIWFELGMMTDTIELDIFILV